VKSASAAVLDNVVLEQFPGGENCSHDSENAFAAFIHGRILTLFAICSLRSGVCSQNHPSTSLWSSIRKKIKVLYFSVFPW